jgi:putative transposase
MTDYRRGSHTVVSIHLHIVWVTKYRRKILIGEVANRVRDIIREECRKLKVDILKGHVSSNHVHILVSIPPQVTISRLIQQRKGKSAYRLLAEYPQIRKQFWGRHVWARGYFTGSSGNITDEVIKAYIENQAHDSDDNFHIDGE